jgi:hypothetical protein
MSEDNKRQNDPCARIIINQALQAKGCAKVENNSKNMAPTGDLPMCVMDFRFYNGIDRKIVIKELAVVWVKSQKRQHWVFLPPYPENCLPEDIRALNAERSAKIKYNWSQGDVPYERLEDILKQCTDPFKDVYVCGNSRAQYLADIINKPVMNFSTLYNGFVFAVNTGNIFYGRRDFESTCLMHEAQNDSSCAKARVNIMANMLVRCFQSVKNGMAKVEFAIPNESAADAMNTKEKRREVVVDKEEEVDETDVIKNLGYILRRSRRRI